MEGQKLIIDTTAEEVKKPGVDWQKLFGSKAFWIVLAVFLLGVFVAIYIVPILIGLVVGVIVYFWFTRVVLGKR